MAALLAAAGCLVLLAVSVRGVGEVGMEERARLCYRRGALEVWSGAVNVGVLRAGGRVLLVGGAPEGVLTRARVAPDQIDWVLVSHHHRDAACGALRAVRHGAKVAAPEAERRLLEGADEFWADDRLRLHAYSFHPSRLSVREPMAVSRGLRDGDALEWRGVTVKAIATPGPTDGEMTFVVECAGVRAAFIGDLMCGPGKLWEFHSLQGPLPSPGYGVSEYHGFGERARVMLASLDRVLAEKPDILVPTHGEVIHEPEQAVRLLRQRVEAVMASYWKTSSGRWYFHGARPEWPNDLTEMETRRCKLPNWIKEVGGTSRLIVADDGHCLLIDSDGDMPQRLLQRQKQGELGPVDALWITHYHDDHVGSVNAARSLLSCSVIAHESMADILRRPQAYFMPCVYPEPIEPDRVTKDGESWLWRGFKLTAYSFPGQTIYDAALLVEHDMTRVLFVGDSLTPGGLDDYCAYNRNLLGPAVGYQHCLGLLERLGVEDLIIVNQHVERGFRFSREFVSELSAELTKRHELFADLFPWDSPNYGLDPAWVRCDPYYQRAHHKQVVSINVVVRNHSKVRRETVVSLRLPQGWSACTGSGRMRTPAGKQGTVRLSARVPDACPAGRYVFGVAVRHAGRDLGELAEAIVEVAD